MFTARAVLFDWDGTLLNSFAADKNAYVAMFQALGVSFSTEDLARHYHPDWYRVYRAARIHRSVWSEADRIWRQAYALESPRLISGARAVLRQLAGRFTLGLVTSGSRDRVCIQLKNLEVADHFVVRVCSEDVSRRKPHPAPLKHALDLAGLAPEDCVYVGDSPQDIEMAHRANVRAIGVLGPFPTEKGLRAAHPALLLSSIKELPQHLRSSPELPTFQQLTVSKQASSQKMRDRKAAKAQRARRPSGA